MTDQNIKKPVRRGGRHKIVETGALPENRGATVKLKDGSEVALFNISGNLHAIDSICPHQGFSLGDSRLYGNIVECDLHGWRFDVKTGECLTDKECGLESYEVVIEDGWIYLII